MLNDDQQSALNAVIEHDVKRLCGETMKDGKLEPVAILYTPEKKCITLLGLGGLPKEAASDVIAQCATHYQALAILFASEAWTVHHKEGEPIPEDLSTHPERQENLMFSISYAGKDRALCVWYPLIRDAEGRLVKLGERQSVEDAEGRFSYRQVEDWENNQPRSS